jgi:CheY-like chemotaxis protein
VSHGYHVLEAKHGRDALLELERQRSPVSLVLTDVVMPELDGPSLAAQLRDLHPELPVLFMSGYASDLLAQHERVARDELVIEKPFTGRELLFAVRDRIDHPSRHAA